MHPSDHFEIYIRASDSDRLGGVRAAAEDAYRRVSAGLNYELSVFEYVEAEYGPLGVRRYLNALVDGSNPVRRAFGVNSVAFNRSFRMSLANRLGRKLRAI